LCSSQGEEEEEHSAHVFTAHGDEMVSNSIGQSSNEWDALSAVVCVYLFTSRGIGRFGEWKSEYCSLQRVLFSIDQLKVKEKKNRTTSTTTDTNKLTLIFILAARYVLSEDN